ncbi:unnamed protein product [marine sediment metagenome]|uniref:Uncharacterized protein n=1 Tax=marine sediment metagenome TaxID=412755 RepID=X1ES76_9ZZZZ
MDWIAYYSKAYLNKLNYHEIIEELWKFPKQKGDDMNDLIVIQVEVNGVETPLYRISEQTLLVIRENSKPKEVPVARTAESNGRKYLLLKAPRNIGKYSGRVIAINLKSNYVNGSWPLEREEKQQNNKTYPDCVFSYKNIKTIS